MSFRNIALGAAFCAALVSAQTPAGSSPSVDTPVSLNFSGTVIDPNGLLIPQAVADAAQPVVSSDSDYPDTYTFALVDLSIPYSRLPNNTDYSTLVPGLGVNRTTRLHWWLDNVTRADDGTFSGADVIADYQGPAPPPGDIPHDYVLYLFNRPSTYTPGESEVFYDESIYNGDDRMNFSVTALAAQLGNPIAARYIQVQNATSTASNGTSASSSNSTSPATGSNSTSSSNSTSTPGSTATASSSPVPYYGNGGGKTAFSLSALVLGLGAAAIGLF